MRDAWWLRRLVAGCALLAGPLFLGCGGDAGLSINRPTGQCVGGQGPQIEGAVRMPHGRVAKAGGPLHQLAGMVWAVAAAIDGEVTPVDAGEEVTLVELREEDVANGTDPGPLEVATTDDNGEFCLRLPTGTTHNVCRYVLQVGNRDDGTLTRAFVFSSSDRIDIDFQSEATVRAILAQIPPATLCAFSPDEIRNINNAVRIAPGTAVGETADEINAVAASIALADPVVDAALSAAVDRMRTPTVTPSSGAPTNTPAGPTATRTEVMARTSTPTPRITRTSAPATSTSGAVTRTPTPQSGSTSTATRPPTRTHTPG